MDLPILVKWNHIIHVLVTGFFYLTYLFSRFIYVVAYTGTLILLTIEYYIV